MNITARRPLFVSIVACGVFLSFGADQTLSGADLSPEDVETLIRQLGGERVAERRAAEQKLLDAGPAVLPLLPDVANVVDPAARDALRRLLPELESQAAAAEIRPSRVTCSGV
ncbi:MAG: hypothetical protein KDA75_19590, partial [Planctomycetaceae bacterium]|nr:hypothetical protein [Planctomycetaceae bacterium]